MLKHVLNPIQIGPVEIPNRIARTGHGTGMGGGTMSDALVDYHVERAKGGVGLTIIELLTVHKTFYPFLRQGEPGLIEGYRKLMERSRPYGMRVFQQIGHNGNEVPPADGSPPWSASDTVGAGLGIQSEAMTKAQIEELKKCYVEASLDCVEGGLDGVELHMAHGYLVQQFFSPLYNFRTDEYGGSFENRTRLAVELLTAVRAALPPTMALGVRLSSELIEGGTAPDEVARIVELFQSLDLIDYINLSVGTDYNVHKIIGAMHEPSGFELPYANPVRAVTKLPILVSGRFRTLEEADQVIHSGEADLVALTRAHIADPYIVKKTIEGREDEIRPCIGCNHGCVGGIMTIGRMGCAVNVAVGAEAMLSEDLIAKTAEPKKVLVVGGGPAGLEAARVAALAGHRVTLAEANSDLGGSISIARRAPRRHGIGDITDWLSREVYRLGVEVRLSTYMEAEDVRELAPDAVILATGSTPRLDGRHSLSPGKVASGMDHDNVVSSHDLLLDRSNRDWGASALIFDDTGHYEGIAAAEFLTEKGLAVTYATSHNCFAPKIEASISAIPALERLSKGKDFRFIPYAELDGVNGKMARVGHRYGGTPVDVEAETVVFVSHNACNRELIDQLQDFPGRVIAVGDARSPRYLQTAIREGHMAARFL